jgi:subtilase family serine protease
LYEADSLPDLAFDSLNVTKKGRYLDFSMNVVNQGLDSANNIQVGVYADNKFVQSFDLNSISIGAKKIVNVENLKIPIGAKKIEFMIDYNNQISELFENNNKIEVNTA